jgi:NADPH:quinone reductase-like Zn-dependent oxidoreductase
VFHLVSSGRIGQPVAPGLPPGERTPVVDRTYPFDDLRAAFACREAGHAKGELAVTV